MAGGFTEKEREQIRIALLSAGYKLSAECGIKKMTVALVAKSSGVAVGSFYNFFDSKEDFVLALIQEAEKEAEIAELTKSQERLSDSIDRLAENIGKSDATNEESLEYFRKAYQSELEWEDMQRRKIDARASEYANTGYGFRSGR